MARDHFALLPFEAQDLTNLDDFTAILDKSRGTIEHRVSDASGPLLPFPRIGDEDAGYLLISKDGRSYSVSITRTR